jgi:hypothetical protein
MNQGIDFKQVYGAKGLQQLAVMREAIQVHINYAREPPIFRYHFSLCYKYRREFLCLNSVPAVLANKWDLCHCCLHPSGVVCFGICLGRSPGKILVHDFITARKQVVRTVSYVDREQDYFDTWRASLQDMDLTPFPDYVQNWKGLNRHFVNLPERIMGVVPATREAKRLTEKWITELILGDHELDARILELIERRLHNQSSKVSSQWERRLMV